MAYNSDGYIMVDFSEVNFRQAHQYIEGLFERMRSVIGTNKFVLVINANGKTPLPSTVSITNGQYVIESCIYTFSVTSSDILHIKRNEPDPASLIDDDTITTNKTWSSYKINNEILSVLPVDSATGNPCEFNTPYDVPFEGLSTSLVPVQSGSGDPTPENIRPITGTTEIDLSVNNIDVSSTLDDTYYKANVDNKNGTVTALQKCYKLGSLDFRYAKNGNIVYLYITGLPFYGNGSSGSADTTSLCEMMKAVRRTDVNTNGILGYSLEYTPATNTGALYVCDPSIDTSLSAAAYVEAFKQKYANCNICANMTTPESGTCTTINASAISGDNSVSSNTPGVDSITVSYKTTIQSYVDNHTNG